MTEQEIRNRTDEIITRVEQVTKRMRELKELVTSNPDMSRALINDISNEAQSMVDEVTILEAEVVSYQGIIAWQPEGKAN